MTKEEEARVLDRIGYGCFVFVFLVVLWLLYLLAKVKQWLF